MPPELHLDVKAVWWTYPQQVNAPDGRRLQLGQVHRVDLAGQQLEALRQHACQKNARTPHMPPLHTLTSPFPLGMLMVISSFPAAMGEPLTEML